MALFAPLALFAVDAPPAFPPLSGDALKSSIARGETGYLLNCTICHGVTGLGVPGTYPPLAASDWLAANRQRAIRAVVAGLKADIVVNGVPYAGQMPAIMIDDQTVADTMTYVLNAWSNPGGSVTPDEVRAVRARTDFKTYEELKSAGDYRPLPKAPPGFAVTELARLPDFATRLASDRTGGKLFVLGQGGDVWRFDPKAGNFKPIITPKELGARRATDLQTLGLTLDKEGRLWITTNRRVDARPLVQNEVTIFRTSAVDADGDPVAPKVWFQTSYPYGVGPFNHGISDIQFGPDGLLYVSSGSRTDAGEEGNGPFSGRMGEVDITACLWRFDPQATEPKLEIVARGIRNAYSFTWDGAGNLFTVSNGPDQHAPEEMDFIVPPRAGAAPRHHGFPFQFGDTPADKKWYAHTPPAPAGVEFVRPVVNLGPAGLTSDQPMSTFAPHSSPTGLVWLDRSWPAAVRNGFLVGRYGNLLPGVGGDDAGFDVLSMKLERGRDGGWVARSTPFLTGVARAIDIHLAGNEVLYVLEYTRVADFKSQLGRLPGRILKIAVVRPSS